MSRDYDEQLNIDTRGMIYWSKKLEKNYHESEPTGYRELDELFRQYPLEANNHFVDIGCGKGRVVFYVNYFQHVPVTGIEFHPQTFHQLSKNGERYVESHSNFPEIELVNKSAETYAFTSEQNIFYMFNPFSPRIFKQVMANIMQSIENHPRTVDLILYYPLESLHFFLEKQTPFELLQTVKLPWFQDKTDRFDIFRYTPK